MSPGKERWISIVAISVLLLGSLSALYVHAFETTSGDNNAVYIDGKKVNIDDLFSRYQIKTITNNISGEKFAGVPLEYVIKEGGISSPEKFSYNLIGKDGYSKTVKWENIKNGVLTKDKRAAFEDLPKAFMVRDIAKIEVVG